MQTSTKITGKTNTTRTTINLNFSLNSKGLDTLIIVSSHACIPWKKVVNECEHISIDLCKKQVWRMKIWIQKLYNEPNWRNGSS